MLLKYGPTVGLVAVAFALGLFAGRGADVRAQGRTRVFELRTYTAPEGQLGALESRFRDHTLRIFEKHGMTNVGYWIPADSPRSENTLIYILAHESRDAAKVSWAAFGQDPEWRTVAEESQKDGRIVSSVESVFMNATDFSAIK